jgi:BlaI family transcriptional regulator, penicillinase repressor
MTMMGILETKGHLTKRDSAKAYLYRAAEPKQKVVGGMVREFIGRVFDGSAKPLLLHLVEEEAISPEELAEILGRKKR